MPTINITIPKVNPFRKKNDAVKIIQNSLFNNEFNRPMRLQECFGHSARALGDEFKYETKDGTKLISLLDLIEKYNDYFDDVDDVSEDVKEEMFEAIIEGYLDHKRYKGLEGRKLVNEILDDAGIKKDDLNDYPAFTKSLYRVFKNNEFDASADLVDNHYDDSISFSKEDSRSRDLSASASSKSSREEQLEEKVNRKSRALRAVKQEKEDVVKELEEVKEELEEARNDSGSGSPSTQSHSRAVSWSRSPYGGPAMMGGGWPSHGGAMPNPFMSGMYGPQGMGMAGAFPGAGGPFIGAAFTQPGFGAPQFGGQPVTNPSNFTAMVAQQAPLGLTSPYMC